MSQTVEIKLNYKRKANPLWSRWTATGKVECSNARYWKVEYDEFYDVKGYDKTKRVIVYAYTSKRAFKKCERSLRRIARKDRRLTRRAERAVATAKERTKEITV